MSKLNISPELYERTVEELRTRLRGCCETMESEAFEAMIAEMARVQLKYQLLPPRRPGEARAGNNRELL